MTEMPMEVPVIGWKMEAVMKCPVTVGDVDSAEIISGPGMGTTQGKSNIHAPYL
jgi:hypothetical protein